KTLVLEGLGRGSLLQRDDVPERNQAAGVGAHIVFPQVSRGHAERLIGLHVNAIRAIIEVEVVHILRAHVNTQRLSNLADGDANGLGFFAIDLHQLLRIIRRESGEQSSQILPLAAAGNDLVRDGVDVLQGVATQILQFKLKSAKAADAMDYGRLELHHDSSWDTEQLESYPNHE